MPFLNSSEIYIYMYHIYIKKISYHNKYLEKGYHNSVANNSTVISIKI